MDYWFYHMDYFNNVLIIFLVVLLLSMQGQKSLIFHQKYLYLCSKDE